MFPISCVRKFANCNFILCYLQTREGFAHLITWNNFRIKRKACWENTTVRVTQGNKFVLEDYYSCSLRYVCCHRNASNTCFSVGPLITFQWKDFSQTCLSPRNLSSNDDSKDLFIDALIRPCTKNDGKTKREEHNGLTRAISMIKERKSRNTWCFQSTAFTLRLPIQFTQLEKMPNI